MKDKNYAERINYQPHKRISISKEPNVTAFTNDAYDALLHKLRKQTNVDLFEKLVSSMERLKIISKVDIYEKAYSVQIGGVDFAYIMVEFFNYLIDKSQTYTGKVPWESITKIFLNINEENFGKDTLKNSYNMYNSNRDKNDPTHKNHIEKANALVLKML